MKSIVRSVPKIVRVNVLVFTGELSALTECHFLVEQFPVLYLTDSSGRHTVRSLFHIAFNVDIILY